MSEVTITLHRPHAAQQRMLDEAKRFNVGACGRRFGKTDLIKKILIDPALRGFPVGYFAPAYKFVIEVWHELVNTLAPLISARNFSDKRIELITGGVIEMWTLDNPDAGRSRKYKVAVVDEAGLVASLRTVFQEAIRPTLMDLSGGAWFLGTPKGHNDFYQLYQLADTRDDWAHWQLPTHDNPFIDRAELDAAKTDMTEDRYRQEILAEFLADGAGVFRYIREAVYGPMPSLNSLQRGGHYCIGVDLGKIHDSTWFVVGDYDTRRIVYIDIMRSDYTVQLARLDALCQALDPHAVVIEENIGQMFIEQARARHLPVRAFKTTAQSKQPLIENLAIAFEHREIAIPDHAELIAELMSYDAERLPSGVTRYSAPDGMHDDGVIALALCLWGMRKRKPMDTTREAIYL